MALLRQRTCPAWYRSQGTAATPSATANSRSRRYLFSPTKQPAPASLKKRFAFLRLRKGKVGLAYSAGLGLKTDFSRLKNHAIIAHIQFNGAGEKYLLRVDTKAKRLYLHATVSEFQTWRVDKSYSPFPSKKGHRKLE